jgi:hypothetical protein
MDALILQDGGGVASIKRSQTNAGFLVSLWNKAIIISTSLYSAGVGGNGAGL